MSINNARKDYIDIFNEFMKDGQFSKVGKILGKGAFGEVRDIIYKNKQMAGKVLQSDKYENSGESYAYDLRLLFDYNGKGYFKRSGKIE